MPLSTPQIWLTEEISRYIPLDKSWEIRRIVLGVVNRTLDWDELKRLNQQPKISNDLMALYRCAASLILGESDLHVGESGTLYRILRYLTWKGGMEVQFIKEWSLAWRNICTDPNIVNWTQSQLLTLDNGTSQWATAAALSGDTERLEHPPYKLQVTYDAIREASLWNITQKRDITIAQQVRAFLEWKRTSEIIFSGEQAEDYCFMRAFEIMGKEDGWKKWPALATHESNRLDWFEEQIRLAETWQQITVNDHRPVAALAMRYNLWRERFLHPDAVNKSWPQFWDFIHHIN